MKLRKINLLAMILVASMASTANAASVNEPYAADTRFNDGAAVLEPFNATSLGRISGEKLALDQQSGDTLIAGLVPRSDMGETRYSVVVARYGTNGQHKLWANGSAGAVDASKKYVYVPYNVAPAHVRAVAVRDVVVGPYGDVNVLIDTRGFGASARIDSVIATFGPTGEYKGMVTHMDQPGVDDVGAKIVPYGSNGFVVSSQPDMGDWASGAKLVVRRYSVNLSNGVPAFDATWGSGGRLELVLPMCSRLLNGAPPVTLPFNCDLRVQRVEMPGSGSSMFIAGDYENQTVNGVSPNRDLFVIKIDTATASVVTAFGNAGIVTYGSNATQDTLRGLALRRVVTNPPTAVTELYLLDAFPRACGSGLIVPHFNADTGAYINRSFTLGGGSNADPSVCAQTDSLLAADLTLPKNYQQNGQYLGVVGTHLHGEMYTGADAFLALLDVDNLTATPQLQDFTHNAGQHPGDSGFSSVIGSVDDGTFTAVGFDRNYDGDASTALTLRMRQDRIFRDGFGD